MNVAEVVADVISPGVRLPSRAASFASIRRESASTMNDSNEQREAQRDQGRQMCRVRRLLNRIASAGCNELLGSRRAVPRCCGALPITKVTAIVSPSARPSV